MAHKQFAQFRKIEEVLGQTLTLHSFKTTESVFGTSIYINATINDSEQNVIITTGSVAILSQFSAFTSEDDIEGMQVAITARGKSYAIEQLE